MNRSVHLDGRALRHLRKTRGHPSAASLAPHLDLTEAQVYALETNRAAATPAVYGRILTYFGLTHGDLLMPTNACPRCGHIETDNRNPQAADVA